jgi:hypothetical protein
VTLDFAEVGAAEAETITLVKTNYQKQMKKRGMFPYPALPFDLYGLSFLTALRLLSERAGPTASKPVAKVAAYGMCWAALAFREAYSENGDHERILSWDAATWAKIEAQRADAAYLRAPGLTPAEIRAEAVRIMSAPDYDGFSGWRCQVAWLRERAFRQWRIANRHFERFLVWWPDGSMEFVPSLDAAFNATTSDHPRVGGAVVTLDLQAIAGQMIDRAPAPLVHVHIDNPQ